MSAQRAEQLVFMVLRRASASSEARSSCSSEDECRAVFRTASSSRSSCAIAASLPAVVALQAVTVAFSSSTALIEYEDSTSAALVTTSSSMSVLAPI